MKLNLSTILNASEQCSDDVVLLVELLSSKFQVHHRFLIFSGISHRSQTGLKRGKQKKQLERGMPKTAR